MIGLNNPFNIRYSQGNKWIGLCELSSDLELPYQKGFCNFRSLEYGVRAACILVMRSYRKKDILTISEIIHRFAPPSENSTDKYVRFVCSKLSCFPFDIPDRLDFPMLLNAMSIYEGNPISIQFIQEVIDKFKLTPYKCK